MRQSKPAWMYLWEGQTDWESPYTYVLGDTAIPCTPTTQPPPLPPPHPNPGPLEAGCPGAGPDVWREQRRFSGWHDFHPAKKFFRMAALHGSTEGKPPSLLRHIHWSRYVRNYDTFIGQGGDDVQQLCEAGEDEFLEIMELVGMAGKPLHVRRLQKTLHEWVSNQAAFQTPVVVSVGPMLGTSNAVNVTMGGEMTPVRDPQPQQSIIYTSQHCSPASAAVWTPQLHPTQPQPQPQQPQPQQQPSAPAAQPVQPPPLTPSPQHQVTVVTPIKPPSQTTTNPPISISPGPNQNPTSLSGKSVQGDFKTEKLIKKFDEDNSKKLLGLLTEELNDYEKTWTVKREATGPGVAIYHEPGNEKNCQQDVDKLKELLNGLKVDAIDCRHQKTPQEEIVGTSKKEVHVPLNEIQSTSSRQGRSFCAGKADTDTTQSSRRNRKFPNQHEYDNPDDSGGKPNNGSTVSLDDLKKSFRTKNGLIVKIYKGPITKLDVDAVVNAANERLANGAGDAGALSKAGGHDFDQECEAVIRRNGFIPVTRNVVTRVGAMAYDGVIHAVGPQWYNYTDKVKCVEKVSDTVIEILKTSVKAGFRSVAMPPISSGLFGVPTDLCAAMYILGIVDFSENTSQLNTLKEFHIIDIKDDILDMVIHFYGIWKQNPQALAPYTLVSQHPKAGKGSNINKSWDGKKDWNAGQGRRHDQGHPRGIQSYSEGHDGHQGYPQRPDGHQGYHQRHDGHQGYPQGHDGHQGYPQRHDGHQGYPKRHDGHQDYPQRHVGRGKPRIPCVFSEKENCFIFREKLKVFIYSANIIDLKVDAIVATDGKEHKGAISKAIEQANGQTRWNQFKNLFFSSFSSNEELQEGQVYFVKPNKMKHLRCIYQIIMKRFSPFVPPTQRELSSLRNIVFKVLSQANSLSTENKKQKKSHPLKRIAMSIPGSGSLETRLHVEKCSEVMFRAIDDFTRRPEMISLMEIHLVDVREDHIIKVLKDTFHKQVKHLTQIKRPLPQRPPNKPLGASGYYYTIPDAESKKNRGRFQTDGHCQKIETWSSDSRRISRKISIDQFADRVSERKGNMMILSGGSSSQRGGAIGAAGGDETGDDCVICMDSFEDPVKLKKCGHKFCKECISESFQQKPVCPVCATVYTVVQGDQPVKGVAEVYKDDKSLPGYPGHKTFIINYDFPDGKQGEEHPEPGEEYKGLNRQAYLPDNTQGQKVLKMIKEAFEQRLIFTVGQSRTTGEDNVVTWNDIHHKTRREGGPERFGYPDDEYLDRVTDELNAKGIGL